MIPDRGFFWLTWAVVILICAGWVYSAVGHEWYPADCCSGHDCGPIDDDRVTRLPSGDYEIDGKWIFSRTDQTTTRRSLSGRYHACFPNPGERPKCIFVPPDLW